MKSIKIRFYPFTLSLLLLQLFAVSSLQGHTIHHAIATILADSGYSSTSNSGSCPSATISYAGSPFCSNSSTAQAVTQSGTAGGAYSSTPGLTIDSVTGAITPSTSTAGVYTVTYTIAAGGSCVAVTATTSVTITTVPAAEISYIGFCADYESFGVTQTGTPGGVYSSTTGLLISATGVTAGYIYPSSSAVGTYTVTYTMAAVGGCAAQTATTSVTIPSTRGAISYAGSPYCTSTVGPQAVTQTGATSTSYSSTPWPGLTINNTTGAITPSTSTPGTYIVVSYIRASDGCSTTDTAFTSVTILASPNPSFALSSTTDTIGQIATYTTQNSESNYQWNLSGTLNMDYTIVSGGTVTDSSISVIWLTTGNKTVSVNYSNAAGCTGTPATTSTNVTSTKIELCPSTGNAICVSSLIGTVYQWQVNPGSGFNNISDGSNYTGTNDDTLQLNGIPSSWYGYEYRCVVNGNNSDICTLQVLDIWTGAVNTAWENPANWSCGSVPDSNTDVVMNSGVVVLNSNTIVRSFTLSPSVNFTINNGFNLTIIH